MTATRQARALAAGDRFSGIVAAQTNRRYSGLMDPTEMRALLDQLGWSQTELARQTNRDIRRTRKQASGSEPIDEPLAVWLRAVPHLLTNPPPQPRRPDDARDPVSAAADAHAVRQESTDP